jgi:eukaryotic-like serine/threonine-protein kinase
MASAPLIANRYRIQKQLGTGGQGDVYEVLDTHEGDVVALKLLKTVPPGGIWQEAAILRRLADPHILPIRNADVAAGQPYLVTELARHGTLADQLAASGTCGVDVDDGVRFVRQACHGIARAHDLRLVHNDIKPMNLFLNAEGECLVGDFGCAALIAPGVVTTFPHCASPETVAPEIAAGWGTPAATASVASDVYALGATAFWLLAAQTPVDLTPAPDFVGKMALVASTPPPRVRDLAPHVPQYVATAVERAMSLDTTTRFRSVTEFAAALGSRPRAVRRWRRTDEHAGHLRCWRGEPQAGGSTYVVCLEQGARPRQAVITTRHAWSGNRITAGCTTTPMRTWGRAVRAVMRRLS